MMKKIEDLHKTEMLTDNESNTMNWMLETGLYAERDFSDLIAEDIAEALNLPINKFRGVLGSLIKKGYLYTDQLNGDVDDPMIVYATDKGYQLDDNYESRWVE